MNQPIEEFRASYRFLSNFWMSPVHFTEGGVGWPSVEHAYQAAKSLDAAERTRIFHAPTPGDAKRLGRHVTLRPDWDDVKVDIMRRCLEAKFAEGSRLAQQLLDTGNRELIEGNTWGDRFWGVCRGEGENWLGRLLMERRAQLKLYAPQS